MIFSQKIVSGCVKTALQSFRFIAFQIFKYDFAMWYAEMKWIQRFIDIVGA